MCFGSGLDLTEPLEDSQRLQLCPDCLLQVSIVLWTQSFIREPEFDCTPLKLLLMHPHPLYSFEWNSTIRVWLLRSVCFLTDVSFSTESQLSTYNYNCYNPSVRLRRKQSKNNMYSLSSISLLLVSFWEAGASFLRCNFTVIGGCLRERAPWGPEGRLLYDNISFC